MSIMLRCVCGVAFSTEEGFRRHIYVVHGEENARMVFRAHEITICPRRWTKKVTADTSREDRRGFYYVLFPIECA